MPSKLRLEWNLKAFREIRTMVEVQADLARRGEAVARRAGDGYKAESGVTGGRGRARTAVFPATPEAARDNAANNTLLKSLDAARD